MITFADIEESILKGENIFIPIEDYIELTKHLLISPYDKPNRIFGRPILEWEEGYTVIVKCVYCGATDGEYGKYNLCAHCGAPIDYYMPI